MRRGETEKPRGQKREFGRKKSDPYGIMTLNELFDILDLNNTAQIIEWIDAHAKQL